MKPTARFVTTVNKPPRFARSYVPVVTSQEEPHPVTKTEHIAQATVFMLVMLAVIVWTGLT